MVPKKVLAIAISATVVGGMYSLSQFTIDNAIRPTTVFVAKHDIPTHTQITEDMLQPLTYPESGIPINPDTGKPMVYLKKSDIVGKWTQVDFGIPQNSFFYQTKVVPEKVLLDSERMKLKPGQNIFTIPVDTINTATGNVVPGTLADIWFTGADKNQNIISGRLFRDVLVISTKNKASIELSRQNSEPAKGEEAPKKEIVPTYVNLALTDEQYALLQGALKLGQIRLSPKTGDLVRSAEELDKAISEGRAVDNSVPPKQGTALADEFSVYEYVKKQIMSNDTQIKAAETLAQKR